MLFDIIHTLERISEYYDEEKKHLKEIQLVVDGKISGDHRGYFESGSIKFRHHYTAGVPHGASYDYDESGKVISRLYYCHGQLSDSPTCNKPSTLKVVKTYPVELILEWLKTAKRPTDILDGYRIHTRSNRLKLFTLSQTCVACGIRATHFQLDWPKGQPIPHLNMYTTRNGRVLLMTRDHIFPKSLGGSNGLRNSQVMCMTCNGRKGNKQDHELDHNFWRTRNDNTRSLQLVPTT